MADPKLDAEEPWMYVKRPNPYGRGPQIVPVPVPKDLTAKEQQREESRITLEDLSRLPPIASGIPCPWNSDDQGPAGHPIRCMVWSDWDDFNDWSELRGGAQTFCKKQCHYGRMGQEELAKQRKAVETARARLQQRRAWRKKHGEMRDGLGILTLVPNRRKVAPFDLGRKRL